MRTTTGALLVAAVLGLAACQPAKTPQQEAAEKMAAALKELSAANPASPGSMAPSLNMDSDAMAKALQQGAAVASQMDASLSPEEKAKMQAMLGAMSGPADPNASAWLAGASKAMEILGTVRDAASLANATNQIAPVYASMTAPAAALKAMPDDKRELAFGSTLSQYMTMSMKAVGLMGALSSTPDVQKGVADLLDKMPQPE